MRRAGLIVAVLALALVPATAHAADRWVAVPLSVANSGPPDSAPATWIGAGEGGVYFATTASLLAADDDGGKVDVYRRRGASLTLATPGTSSNVGSPQAVSRDGSTLVFGSTESLVPEDQDEGLADLYATTDGVTRLVTAPEPDAPFTFFSLLHPSMRVSDDGRIVAFSTFEGLVADDDDSQFDVYVWNRDTGRATLASPGAAGGPVSLDFGGLSRDGRYAFMETTAALTPDDGDSSNDVYRYDSSTDTLGLFTPGTAGFSYAGISDDGSALFIRTAEALDPDDADGGQLDVYRFANGVTRLVSSAPGHGDAPEDAQFQRSSEDGGVAFFTTAEQLTDDDVDGGYDDIYRRGRDGGVTLVSTGPDETLFDRSAVFSDITPDGSRVFFYTGQDLTSDDGDGGFSDAYERSGATTTRISVGAQNDDGFDDASFAGFSDDASWLFFQTTAAMTPGDGDALDDLYARHAGETSLVTPTPEAPCTLLPSTRCEPVWHGVSGDGRRVRFAADEDLSALDGDGSATDVYESRLAVPARVAVSAAPLAVPPGGEAVPVDDALTVDDPYDDVLSATVHLEGGELGFADRDGISGSLNAAGDTLTLTGRATAADYEAALRSVTYRSTTPGARSASFSADNGSGPGEPARRRVEVPSPVGPGEPVEPPGVPGTPLRLAIVDSGGRVAHLRRGRWFRLPGLHFACPAAAPAGCSASAVVRRGGRRVAGGSLALGSGERSEALLARASRGTVRRLRTRGRLRLAANVTFSAAGAEPVAEVTHFRLLP